MSNLEKDNKPAVGDEVGIESRRSTDKTGAGTVKSGSAVNGFRMNTATILVVCIVASLFSGALGAGLMYSLQNDGLVGRTSESLNISTEDGNKTMSDTQQAIADVADKVAPSVVSISTAQSVGRSNNVFEGAGTGIVISSNGYIVTNKHVVEGARSISVATTEGEIYEDVRLVGSDPLNDVSFLKIAGVDDLVPATIGDSLTLSIGQPVVAIGNSLGEYQNTVTSGIVSGLGRPVVAQSGDGGSYESLTDLIQTDAAINPGNSGGPLVNLGGQVVGINTAVATEAQGIGFAIPISAVRGMLEGVVETGEVSRPYIGVRYVDVNPVVAKSNNLPVKNGAYVSNELTSSDNAIEPGGPADNAGIKDGDIIIKVNDTNIGPNASLGSLVSQYRPGDEVELTVVRGDKEVTLTAKLDKYDDPGAEAASETRTDEVESPRDLRWLFGF